MNSTRAILHSAFFEPLRNPQRLAVYMGGALGTFGFALINLVLGYDLGAGSLNNAVGYYLMMFASLGLIVSPLVYAGFACADSRAFRLSLVALQMAGLLGAMYFTDVPLLLGLCITMITGPFWVSYHVGMFNNTSDDKRGFEVALAHFLIIGGGITAALFGGYMLHKQLEPIAMLIGAIALILGTLLLQAQSIRRNKVSFKSFSTSCWELLPHTKAQALRVFRQGLLDAPKFIVAVVMHKLGFSALATGGVMATSIVLGLAVTPFVGAITHHSKQHEQKIGVSGVALSWLVLILFPISAATFTVFLVIISLSLRFIVAGIESYWYGLRSYEALTLHEIMLSLSRLGLTVAGIPFLFWNATYYLYFAAIIAVIAALLEYKALREVRHV